MNKYSTVFYKVYHAVVKNICKIKFSKTNLINTEQKQELAKLLAKDYYIILTGSKSHLSSILISLLSWIKTGNKSRYSHVLMNCDNITDSTDTSSFKFVEATTAGVHYSTFDQIFACDYVCILSPVGLKLDDWTRIIDELVEQNGIPYDDLFDLIDNTKMSCVEVVLNALKATDYVNHFRLFDKMIQEEGNLTPQMFRECPEFMVRLEY